jgi:hypothetical protein
MDKTSERDAVLLTLAVAMSRMVSRAIRREWSPAG